MPHHFRFSWDIEKASSNSGKHGVSFDEACTVFLDERALLIDDIEHSQEEERFVILGFSSSARLSVVCHCYRSGGDVVRIISARKATVRERSFYATSN